MTIIRGDREMQRIAATHTEALRKAVEKEIQLHRTQIYGMHNAFSLFVFALLEARVLDRARLDELFSGVTKTLKEDQTGGTERYRENVSLWMNNYLTCFDQQNADSPKRPPPFHLIQGGKADDVKREAPEDSDTSKGD